MLVREKDSLDRMVNAQFVRIETARKNAWSTAQKKIVGDYFDDPTTRKRLGDLSGILGVPVLTLTNNIINAVWGNNSYGLALGPDSQFIKELQALGFSPRFDDMHYAASPLASIVSVATSTSNKKWKDIQTGVYAFAAECSTVTTHEQLEEAVKKMLTYLA